MPRVGPTPAISLALALALGACQSESVDAVDVASLDLEGDPIVSVGGTPDGETPSGDAPPESAPPEVAEPDPEPDPEPAEDDVEGAPEEPVGPVEPAEPEVRDPNAPREFVDLSWDLLSGFDYEMLSLDELDEFEAAGEPLRLDERLPIELIDEYDERDVAVLGFMIPFEYDDDGIASFTLVRDQAMCCFGAAPRMNHWIEVRMEPGRRSEAFDLEEILVHGRISVGEVVEDGYVMSLYRMEAHEVLPSY